MIVKIIIRRAVGEEKVKELIPLLEEIRTLAKERPDYISGETLKSLDKPDEFLVISTWNSPVSWEKWLANKERQEIQKRIDSYQTRKVLKRPIISSFSIIGKTAGRKLLHF